MSIGEIKTWARLAAPEHAELVRRACEMDPGDVREVQRVRAIAGDAELTRVALLLGQARRKLLPKFGDHAASMWADPQGAEMASSVISAEHKARRILAAINARKNIAGKRGRVIDLCCGIGGDAMVLARCGVGVLAVDMDPCRAWMAGMNMGDQRAAMVADAGLIDLGEAFVHIDPARRTSDSSGVRRGWRLDDLQPGPSVLGEILARARSGAAVKLGPGVDHADARAQLPSGEIEFISENGRLTQAVLWVGGEDEVSGGTTRATLVRRGVNEPWSEDQITTMLGLPDEHQIPIAEEFRAKAYVLEPDDSVERARLQHVLCETLDAELLHPALGVLTSDRAIDSAWTTRFEVLEQMRWDMRSVRECLRSLGGGIVEVKTRGAAIQTDRVQGELRGDGDRALVVFVYRFDRELRAIVAERT